MSKTKKICITNNPVSKKLTTINVGGCNLLCSSLHSQVPLNKNTFLLYLLFFIPFHLSSKWNYLKITTFNGGLVNWIDLPIPVILLWHFSSGDGRWDGWWPFQLLFQPTAWTTGFRPEEKAKAPLNCVSICSGNHGTLIPAQLISNEASSCSIGFLKQCLFLGLGRNVRYFGSPEHLWLLRAL